MNIKKIALLGAALFTMSTVFTVSSASVTIKTIDNDNNTRSYTVKNESYQQQAYQGQPDYQYQGHQGNYYSQYYRPSRVLLPSAQTSSPAEMLEYSIKKVLNFLARPQENASLEQITYFLKQEITPHFDFEYMARWVAGRYYRLMSPEQQMQFTETFSELFITTFVQKLSNYQNYPPVVDGFRSKRTSENEALASARIMRENGGSVQVDFKFLKTPRGWKVVDVKANGVSALFYYRNFFNEQIRKRSQQQQVFK